jgi:hypothetical protein
MSILLPDFTPLIIERLQPLKDSGVLHQIIGSADFNDYSHLKRGHYRPPLAFVVRDNVRYKESSTTDRRQHATAYYGVVICTENRVDEYGNDSATQLNLIENEVGKLMLTWEIDTIEELACPRMPYIVDQILSFFRDDILMCNNVYAFEYFIYPNKIVL